MRVMSTWLCLTKNHMNELRSLTVVVEAMEKSGRMVNLAFEVESRFAAITYETTATKYYSIPLCPI